MVGDHSIPSTEVQRRRGHSFASFGSWRSKIMSRKAKEKDHTVGTDDGQSVNRETIDGKI